MNFVPDPKHGGKTPNGIVINHIGSIKRNSYTAGADNKYMHISLCLLIIINHGVGQMSETIMKTNSVEIIHWIKCFSFSIDGLLSLSL